MASSWTAGNSAVLSVVANKLRITVDAGQSYGKATQTITTIIGETCVWSVDYDVQTASKITIFINNLVNLDITSGTGTKYFQFTATSTSTTIELWVYTASAYSDFDNISIVAASADRSGQNNSAKVIGTLNRSADVTGALAGWHDWSTNDNCQIEGMDLSVDHAVFCWVKFYIGGYVVTYGDLVTGKQRGLYADSTTIRFYGYNEDLHAIISVGDSNWHFIGYTIDSGTVKVWVDGLEIISGAPNLLTPTGTTQTIGYRSGGAAFDGSIARLATLAKNPTVGQIKEMYRDGLAALKNPCTIDSTVVSASYDGVTGDDLLITATDVIRFKNGVQVSKTASTVGTINTIESTGTATVTGCSTGALIEVNQRPLREDKFIRPDKIPRDFTYLGDSSNIKFPDQTSQTAIDKFKGWRPLCVYVAGYKQTLGAADDYTVEFDGFNYFVEFAVAPGAVDVIVTGEAV